MRFFYSTSIFFQKKTPQRKFHNFSAGKENNFYTIFNKYNNQKKTK
jgi:hypothetical protein